MLTFFSDDFDLDLDTDDNDFLTLGISADDIEEERDKLFADIAEKFVQLHSFKWNINSKWCSELKKIRSDINKDIYGISKLTAELNNLDAPLEYTFPFGASCYNTGTFRLKLIDGNTFGDCSYYVRDLFNSDTNIKAVMVRLVCQANGTSQFWTLLDSNKIQIIVTDSRGDVKSEEDMITYLKNDVRKARNRAIALTAKIKELETKARQDFEAAEGIKDKLEELQNNLTQSIHSSKDFLSEFNEAGTLDVRSLDNDELATLLEELFEKAITQNSVCSDEFETSVRIHDDWDYHDVDITLEVSSECDVEVKTDYDEDDEIFDIHATFTVTAEGGNEDLDCSSEGTYDSDFQLVGNSNMTVYDLWHSLCEDLYYIDWSDVFEDIDY